MNQPDLFGNNEFMTGIPLLTMIEACDVNHFMMIYGLAKKRRTDHFSLFSSSLILI